MSTVNDRAPISAAEAAVSKWLHNAGYAGIGEDEHACLLAPERACEALVMLDHWEARCDVARALTQPLRDTASRAMRATVDAARQDRTRLLAIQRDWIGHDEAEETDTAETVHALLCEYINELA